MAWTPKVWVDRATQHVARFVLTATGNANEYDLTRVWGTVFTEGDKPDATNLNAEFGHVKTELDAINTNLNVVEGTLVAGQTSITISDSRITASGNRFLIYVDTAHQKVSWSSFTFTTGSITIIFPAQATSMVVGIEVRH